MHLQQYLDKLGLTREDFASRHSDDGVTFTKVRRWCRAEGYPRPVDVALLERVTSGVVTGGDMARFFEARSGEQGSGELAG